MAQLYLACLPKICDYHGSDSAKKRIFPSLLDDSETIEGKGNSEEDWKELVHTEFEENHFNAVEIVLRDLSEAEITTRPVDSESSVVNDMLDSDDDDEDAPDSDRDERRYFHFDIPEDHFESWYRALNLARLVSGEKYGVPILPFSLGDDRAEAEKRVLEDEDEDMEDRLLAAACCRCYEPFLGVLIELMSSRL